jgi:Holliday junction resolvase
MGKKSRNKVAAAEREVVNLLKQHGHKAQRTAPLQAAEGTKSGADVLLDDTYHIEVKRRKDGFSLLHECLENADFLFLRTDRKNILWQCLWRCSWKRVSLL